jgi:hypothetical protein
MAHLIAVNTRAATSTCAYRRRSYPHHDRDPDDAYFSDQYVVEASGGPHASGRFRGLIEVNIGSFKWGRRIAARRYDWSRCRTGARVNRHGQRRPTPAPDGQQAIATISGDVELDDVEGAHLTRTSGDVRPSRRALSA